MDGNLLDKYNYARKACRECLEDGNVLVDMHGLVHWAGVVDRIRREFKELGI